MFYVGTHYNAAVSALRLSISNNHQKGTLKERADTVLISYTRFWSFSVHSYYLLQKKKKKNPPFVLELVLFASPADSKLSVDEIAGQRPVLRLCLVFPTHPSHHSPVLLKFWRVLRVGIFGVDIECWQHWPACWKLSLPALACAVDAGDKNDAKL